MITEKYFKQQLCGVMFDFLRIRTDFSPLAVFFFERDIQQAYDNYLPVQLQLKILKAKLYL
jgi:hypothetical protein